MLFYLLIGKAFIRNPLSLLAHERSRFAPCQWELLTPTDISIPLTPAQCSTHSKLGNAYSAFKLSDSSLYLLFISVYLYFFDIFSNFILTSCILSVIMSTTNKELNKFFKNYRKRGTVHRKPNLNFKTILSIGGTVQSTFKFQLHLL